LSFTGYLLPWDQLAFWAVTVSVNIVASAPGVGGAVRELVIGGRDVGQTALMRFYLLHIVVLPIAVAVLFAYHMWRIRKDGGLARPLDDRGVTERISTGSSDAAEGTPRVVTAVPAIVYRIAVVALATWLAVTVLAIVVPSPLEEAADPLVTPNPAKAPWYFLWLQEVVADTTVRVGPVSINGALVGGLILPVSLLVLITLWPWLDRAPASTVGVWMPRERRTQLLVFAAIVAVVTCLTILGMLRGPSWQFYWPWQAWPAAPTRF
jgi:quinol-cytochrome oxidoreductase complex cytochrome b subunit